MEIRNLQSPQFTGKYTLDANQTMPSKRDCLVRDSFIGAMGSIAKNSQEIQAKLDAFYAPEGAYSKNVFAPCNLTFDLKDSDNKFFEESMTKIGQNFDKIA
jgi:hypothetical protein